MTAHARSPRAHSSAAAVVLLVVSGCTFDDTLPAAARLGCESDDDCVTPLVCGANGLCRDPGQNAPPTVTLGAIDRSIGEVRIPVVVSDLEGDPASVELTLVFPDGAEEPVALVDAQVQAVPQGAAKDLVWVPDLDPTLFVDGFVLRGAARDGTSDALGPVSTSAPFAYGNSPPTVAELAVPDVARDLVPITFSIADPEGDAVSLERLEVSLDGTFADAVEVPIDEVSFPLGLPVDFPVPATGDAVDTGIGWQSDVTAPADAQAAALRVTVRDTFGATSAVLTSSPFIVDNADFAPSVTIVTPPPATAADAVALTVDIQDADGDPCLLDVRYRVGGDAPLPAASDSVTVNLAPGQHTFVWRSTQLGFDVYDVVLEVRVSDGGPFTEPVVTDPFTVDNRGVGGNAPPTVFVEAILPPDGPEARFLDDVLVTFTTSDPNGAPIGTDTVDVVLEASTDFDPNTGVGTFFPLTPAAGAIALAGLAADVVGVEHAFLWDARTDLATRVVDTDGNAAGDRTILDAVPFVVVRARAADNAEPPLDSAPFVSAPFALGDAPPTATPTPLSGDVSGAVPIEVTLTDAAPFDISDVEVEVRPGPGETFRRARISLGQQTGLAPSASGQTYVLVWDSLASPDDDPTTPQGLGRATVDGVELRVRAVDHPDASTSVFGAFQSAGTVRVVNQTPPRVELVTVKSDGGLHNGAVPITFRLVDEQGDAADVLVEYSRDQGLSFTRCSEMTSLRSEGTQGLGTAPGASGGVVHTFVWDSTSDLFTPSPSTVVRITAADAFAGPGEPVEVMRGAPAGPSDGDAVTSVFQTRIDVVGFDVSATAIGDLDVDGVLDIAGAREIDGSVQIKLGNGATSWDGTFGTTTVMQTAADAQAVQIGDVTGDGVPDVVAATARGFAQAQEELVVIRSNGAAGTFTELQRLNIGGVARSLALGDFDGDGDLDAVVGHNNSSPSITVFRGEGTAPNRTLAFVATHNENGGCRDLRAADVNDDGFVDVVCNASVFLGQAGLGFGPSVDFTSGTRAVDVADLDADGLLDVIAASTSEVRTFLGDGLGGFSLADVVDGGDSIASLSGADLSGDGAVDVVTANFDSNDAYVYVGDGQGGLSRAVSLPAGSQPNDADIVDLDEDGLPDVVVSDRSGSLRVFRSRAVGAFDAGATTLAAVHEVPSRVDSSRHQGPPLADLDEDGAPDLLTATASNGGTWSVARGDLRGRAALGTFLSRTDTAASRGTAITVADFTGDDILDILGLSTNNDALIISVGAGAAAFTNRPTVALGGSSLCHAVGDVDNDGDLDVVSARPGVVELRANDGAGALAAPVTTSIAALSATEFPLGCELGDFTGDGRLDLAIGLLDKVHVLAQLSNGQFNVAGVFTFTVPNPGFGFTTNPLAVRAADFNQDGILDLVALSLNRIATAQLDVLLGNGTNGRGNGTFTAVGGPRIDVNHRAFSLDLADVTGDGVVDIVTGGGTNETLIVFEGRGTGGVGDATFSAGVELPSAGVFPLVHHALDVNSDGAPDLVSYVDSGGQTMTTLRSDPRDAWLRRLDPAASGNALGDVIDALPDLFGNPVTASFSLRRFFRVSDDGAGDLRRAPDVLRADLLDELRRVGAVSSSVGLVPLTSSWRASGDVALVRVPDPGGASGTRLEVRQRFGPRVDAESATEFDRQGLVLGGGTTRAIVVDLPFLVGRNPTATVAVFQRTVDFVRASDDGNDPFAADVDADRYLPRRPDGAGGFVDVVRERSSHRAIARAPGDNLAACTSRCFAVDVARRRVRVLTDSLGAFAAFNQP